MPQHFGVLWGFWGSGRVLGGIFGGVLGIYLVFLRVDPRPQEGGLPAVHVLLGVAGQLDLPQVLVDVPGGQQRG